MLFVVCNSYLYFINHLDKGYVHVSQSQTIINLPMPSGQMQEFAVVSSSIMPSELSAKYPSLNSSIINFDTSNLHKLFNVMIRECKSKLKVNSLKYNEFRISVVLEHRVKV